MKDLKLFSEGQVSVGDRQFTRLIGGFGEGKPIFLMWQCAELLGQETREITQNFERNQSDFEKGIDFLDLKSDITLSDSGNSEYIRDLLKGLGYSQNKLNATKQWWGFSLSGMMKLVKIATTKESWIIYDNFLEDYFKTKAINKVLGQTLEEEKKFLLERKKFILGSIILEEDDIKRLGFTQENEKLSKRITEIDMTLSQENIMEKLNPKLSIAEKFTDSKGSYDMNIFSKILDIKGLGRNKLFEWLRNKEILMGNNLPYQKYMDNFKVIIVNNGNYTNSKTIIKPQGVEFLFKALIKDGKIIPKTLGQIMEELEGSEVA